MGNKTFIKRFFLFDYKKREHRNRCSLFYLLFNPLINLRNLQHIRRQVLRHRRTSRAHDRIS